MMQFECRTAYELLNCIIVLNSEFKTTMAVFFEVRYALRNSDQEKEAPMPMLYALDPGTLNLPDKGDNLRIYISV